MATSASAEVRAPGLDAFARRFQHAKQLASILGVRRHGFDEFTGKREWNERRRSLQIGLRTGIPRKSKPAVHHAFDAKLNRLHSPTLM
jgi:hypothetical protein